jgi:protein-S-isoprenylcysteine O-methyltransferase Ste14
LIFGSLWSIIPASVSIVLLVIRTRLEDKTLVVELKGYSDYTRHTKDKLIPWLW